MHGQKKLCKGQITKVVELQDDKDVLPTLCHEIDAAEFNTGEAWPSLNEVCMIYTL